MVRKDFNDKYRFYIATALIICTVIGAGVFGIPYAVSQSGFWYGILNLVLVGFFVTMMTLYMGEVVLRTKSVRHFAGLAGKYMGQPGKYLMLISVILGTYGALIAYMLGVGNSIANLIGGNSFMYSMIFFALASTAILFGLRMISRIELVLAGSLIFILSAVSITLLPQANIANLSYLNSARIFAPYGVILFACLGYSIIPEVEIMLGNEKKKMFKSIALAMAISLTIYALFTTGMVGVYGKDVSQIATGSLTGILFILGNIVAIVAMSGAFLSVGTVTKDTWQLDFKIPRLIAWVLACFVPLGFVVITSPSFFTAVEYTGVYAGGLTGILCCWMAKIARKKGDVKPAYVVPGGDALIWLTGLVFAGGMVYQTLLIFGLI